MAKAKARPERVKPTAKEGKDKPEAKHLVQRDGRFNCVLHRENHVEYRENGRPVLDATQLYDDITQIEQGVLRQRSVKNAEPAQRATLIAQKIPLYTFKHVNKRKSCSIKNFET